MSSNHLHTRHKTRGLQTAYSHLLHLRVDTKHGSLAGGVSSVFFGVKVIIVSSLPCAPLPTCVNKVPESWVSHM